MYLSTPKKKNVTNEQIAWFGQYINTVESVLYGVNFKDPVKGYRQYLDVDSFVDWYLINDFAKNPDATFFASVFLYKDRNGKLKMGPLWDFDIAFGNIDFNPAVNEENGFWVMRGAWFNRLVQDDFFRQKVSDRFDQLKSLFDSIPKQIATVAEKLKSTGAIDRNFQKWPILGSYVWPNYPPFPGNYDGEIRRLTDWFKERQDWLNIYLPLSKADQCERLKNTKPHISITDTDEFETGADTRIKTTNGYARYFWNNEEGNVNTISMNAGKKYWVQVEDDAGCKSLVSDTLYFIKKARIIVDSTEFVYDGSPKTLPAYTIPEGLPVKFTYDGDSVAPVNPGEYHVAAIINSPFYKDSINVTLHIKKIPQQISFPPLPPHFYISDNVLLNAAASSGLPIQYIISGNAVIRENWLIPGGAGELTIYAIQPGNEFYQSADTVFQSVLMEYENNFNKNLKVFPNPFIGSVTIEYPDAPQTHLGIYSRRGKLMQTYLLTGHKANLNLGILTKGVYILRFSSSKGQGSYKIFKE